MHTASIERDSQAVLSLRYVMRFAREKRFVVKEEGNRHGDENGVKRIWTFIVYGVTRGRERERKRGGWSSAERITPPRVARSKNSFGVTAEGSGAQGRNVLNFAAAR